MLFFVREQYPTYRPDVDRLFFGEMLDRGHQIDFVMQGRSDTERRTICLSEHGRIFVGRTTPGSGFLSKARRHLLAFKHVVVMLAMANLSRYDCIQFKDAFVTAALGVCFAKLKRIRFYFWLSFPLPEALKYRATQSGRLRSLPSYVRGLLEESLLYRVILPASDHIFVQSERMKEDMVARGVSAAKLTPVPMAVDLKQLDELIRDAHAHGSGSGTPCIGYLGTLVPERGLVVLIEMLECLRTEFGIEAELLLVGDGEQPSHREALERKARELNVQDRVHITGLLPRPQALDRLRSVDVCISPFYPTPILLSTSPTKLIEYMALGLPVVANEHPEQSVIVRESGGGVCVAWGARSFAQGVADILNMSREQRASLGERGRKWVERNRTYDQIADRLDQTYCALLSGEYGR